MRCRVSVSLSKMEQEDSRYSDSLTGDELRPTNKIDQRETADTGCQLV
ncbi:MAG: hypothetical protein F6K47_37320 [Symploca sp. SIO2E6]|nr:hypothetical protein [Symploca sp. SIO2E6]